MDIINLHITSYQNHDNIGDMRCAPLLYFDFPGRQKKITDVRLWDESWDAPIILGGGGILFPSLLHIYESKVPKAKQPVIFWGAGDNMPVPGDYPGWMDRIGLVGVRDHGTRHPWVPCASCMSPLFDNVPEPTREMVVYDHFQYPVPVEGFERMRNDCTDFDQVIRFLASGETLYTSSYHGVYWGVLLGRKVLLSPYLTRSTRWMRMKHKPSVVSEASRWKEAREAAQPYPGALGECREANLRFYDRALELLGSKAP
jgi:hypothetical protein